ncbi:lipopolysaccharide/colanic/teichoic acid biosynthesis glycosyltransferase [Bosea sp. OAE752]|uniref:Sugar transferase n=1 Tax=Bosea spartocytisi TaxID=2773451 RepID=A0A927HYN9_9HYPH|nr:sugar transferase [Bosea spartocytisi]MBD3844631.1 sugar transferase [Bosea spartocytisi]MCT4470834.1 sugar transferase [Bosea spartocytisi]
MSRFPDSQNLPASLALHMRASRSEYSSMRSIVKRAIDIAAGVALVLLLAPLMLLIAALIRAGDGGPALFKQPRIGRSGKGFRCLKFRTMAINADEALQHLLASDAVAAQEWAESQKLTYDPRITPVGAFLRRSSLDELPQLFNIIAGEMSFVGPRPIVAAERERYGEAFSHCFSVPPGLTGLWQISGRSDCSYATRVSLDSQYASEWHLLLDAKILVKTVPAVLMQRGSR